MNKIRIGLCGMALATLACATGAKPGRKNLELIQASRQGDVNRVVALVSQGADLNAIDSEGWTPYLAASAEGNWKVMRVLRDLGAKTDPGF